MPIAKFSLYWLGDFRGIKLAVLQRERILVPSSCRTIASICSAVSVKRFNFPGATRSVFLFGDFRTTPAASEKGRILTPSTCRSDRAFALRFFPHRLSVIGSLFFFFVTRLGCRELFEWAIVSRRSDCSNGTSLP